MAPVEAFKIERETPEYCCARGYARLLMAWLSQSIDDFDANMACANLWFDVYRSVNDGD